MTVVNWFSPYKPTHIKAWETFLLTGNFPLEAIPGDASFPDGWEDGVREKMADAWFHYMRTSDFPY